MVKEWLRCVRLMLFVGFAAMLTLGILGCVNSGGAASDPVNHEAELRVLKHMASVSQRIDMLLVAADADVSDGAATLDARVELSRDLASQYGLAVIADHFFDERLTCPFGSFDNGGRGDVAIPVGDALFELFQRAFYPDSYPFNEHPCLRSKSLAREWIADHNYDLAALIADFEKTRER